MVNINGFRVTTVESYFHITAIYDTWKWKFTTALNAPLFHSHHCCNDPEYINIHFYRGRPSSDTQGNFLTNTISMCFDFAKFFFSY